MSLRAESANQSRYSGGDSDDSRPYSRADPSGARSIRRTTQREDVEAARNNQPERGTRADWGIRIPINGRRNARGVVFSNDGFK